MGWLTRFYDAQATTTQDHTTNNKQYPTGSLSGLLTQNVRGFREAARPLWMAAWKTRVNDTNIAYLLIQETHVGTVKEANELQVQWARAWGRQHDPAKPMSFWSVADSASVGVGILLRPDLSERFERLEMPGTPGRILAITSDTTTIVNIYAPNDKATREVFYHDLEEAMKGFAGRWFLAGDFNCVLDPISDRSSASVRSKRPESPALAHLVRALNLLDTVQRSPSSDVSTDLQFTHFQPEVDQGARLDRCYVPAAWSDWIVGAEVVMPKVATDHLGYVTWIRDPNIQPKQRPLAPLLFPIRGRDQPAIDQAIETAVERVLTDSFNMKRTWDDTLRHLEDALREIKRREKRLARRARQNWERRLRKRVLTRQDLIEYEQGRLVRQMQRRHGARLLRTEDRATALLRRLNDRQQRVLTMVDGDLSFSNADRFAVTWGHLLTTRHAICPTFDLPSRLQQLCRIPGDHKLGPAENHALLVPVTAAEVEATIADLGAHKAGGSDRLNNDFYRAWAPLLARTLALEFNRILDGAAMPLSFREAIIVPLPKNGNSTNAMDYRPISLLQSSYKILTKLLATRLQNSLGKVINADQNGFVRGRDMANNIFLMQALLTQDYEPTEDTADTSPVAVLLDFKKAYDTLDRNFLNAALRAFGYADEFVRLVERLHDGTTARFLVNGDLSNPLQIRTGIRQGCPLAPLLFLLAAETLKYAVVQTAGVSGINLQSAGRSYLHGFSAFVDDSVVFVERGHMLPAIERTLQEFADLSGLQVQPAKSHAIVMNPRCQEHHIGTFPIVPPGTTVPYLGVEVGLGDPSQANWTKRMDKLTTSIGAASRWVTSLHDRVTVLNVVGLPALLFTAKYASPSLTDLRTIDALWRQYLWHGTISTAPLRAHKIVGSILSLPRDDLGLGLRDVPQAMIDQAARTVLQWNTRTTDKYWAAYHNLLLAAIPNSTTRLHCYPSRHAATVSSTMDGRQHLLRLGWQRANASLAGRYPVPPALDQLKQDALSNRDDSTAGLWWISNQEGRITIPRRHDAAWAHVSTMVYANMPHEIRSFWGTFPWTDNTWVVDAQGLSLRAADYPCINIQRLEELDLRPDGDGHYRFRNPCGVDPVRLRTSQRQRLVQWLHTVIINAGFHRADPISWFPTRAYSLNTHPTFNRYEWHFHVDGTAPASNLRGLSLEEKWGRSRPGFLEPSRLLATASRWGAPVIFVQATGSSQAHDDLRVLQDHAEGAVLLAGHPALHHGPALLTPKSKYSHERRRTELRFGLHYAGCIQRGRAAALSKLTERLERGHARDPELQLELRAGTIRDLRHHMEGVTEYQAVFRYRLVMGALNLRGSKGEALQCPHTWCSQAAEVLSLTHIVWTCDAARRVWTIVHRQWTRRPLPDQVVSIRSSIGRERPVLARAIRQELHDELSDLVVSAQAQKIVWKITQAVIPHQLWLHRNASAFNGADPSIHEVVAKIWATITNQISALAAAQRMQSDTYDLGRAIAILLTGLEAETTEDRATAREVRLYYDGGSRGNPGVSGAGSVLLEREPTTDHWCVVWWASTYLGPTNTNNVAEHTAVAQGLEEAARRYGGSTTRLTIVGDSMLATRQLKDQIRAVNHNFAGPIRRSRTALLRLHDYSFQHTLRAGNTAADWLANRAMDTRATTTSSTCLLDVYSTTMTGLDTRLHHDTTHACTPATTTNDILTTIKASQTAASRLLPAASRKRPRPAATRSTAPRLVPHLRHS